MDENKKKDLFDYFASLDKKGMLLWTIFSYIGYFMIAIFAPVLTIAIKYGLFNLSDYVSESNKTLAGWGLVLLMIAIIVTLKVLRNSIEKVDDVSKGGAIFKYTVKTISNLILPLGGMLMLYFLTKNFNLAKDTLMIMAIFYIVAGIIDGVLLSVIDRENNIRRKAKLSNEVDARREKV